MIGLGIVVATALLINLTRTQEEKRADERELVRINWVLNSEAAAKSAVRQLLKDPGSAEFQNVGVIAQENFDSKGYGVVCGEVNAKNSFGAYIGFSSFVFADGVAVIDRGSRTFGKIWGARCGGGKHYWQA